MAPGEPAEAREPCRQQGRQPERAGQHQRRDQHESGDQPLAGGPGGQPGPYCQGHYSGEGAGEHLAAQLALEAGAPRLGLAEPQHAESCGPPQHAAAGNEEPTQGHAEPA